MNMETIEKIDVCKTYFEVDNQPINRFSAIFEVENSIFMNKVISRKNAIQIVKQECGIYERGIPSLYISFDPVAVHSIKNFIGEKIYNGINERLCGWLFQYDPTPFANWYHKCFYYFVVNELFFCIVENKYGLCDSIKMEEIY